MGVLLHAWLQGDRELTKPFMFDVHGGSAWCGIEFDFEGEEARALTYEGKMFAMQVQAARALQNGLVIMSITRGARLDGKKGNYCMLSIACV